jgi:hypothetical protein
MTNLPTPTNDAPPSMHPERSARWRFLRDVAVFQLKLFLNNVHNFVQIPLTLVVAAIDVMFKGKEEGERFYKMLEYGRTIDDSIDIYSVIGHRERSLHEDYTVDALVGRLETVIVREYQKGGTAASVRTAVDRAIDELQTRADQGKSKAGDAIKKAAETLRKNMDDSPG